MEEFRNRHKNHPVHQSIEKLWKILDKIDIPKSEESKAERDGYARFLRVCRHLTHNVEETDPVLWSPTSLNASKIAFDTLLAAITQFQQDQNINHLRNQADGAIDQFAAALPSFAGRSASESANAIKCYISDIQSSLGEIDEFKEAVKLEKDQFITAYDEFNVKLKSIGKELTTFQTQFEEQKKRVDSLITDQQTNFTNEQALRTEQFTENQKIRSDEFIAANKEREEVHKKLFLEWNKAGETTLAELAEQLVRAKDIVGIVANTGVAGNYQIEADKEVKAAKWLRIIAFTCYAFMGWMVYEIVSGVGNTDFSWEASLFRIGVVTVMVIPALYASKESSKHRSAARRSRQTQLELTALEPYLEKISEPKEREEIIKRKVDEYFGAGAVTESENDSNSSKQGSLTVSGDQLVKMVSSVISKIK